MVLARVPRHVRGRRSRVAATALCLILLSAPAEPASLAPALGKRGMVVSSHADATRAGLAMLAAEGNAVDAAVATAFAVSVTQPFSTGIGGGGFCLIRLNGGSAVAVDARERAPLAADRDMYVRPGVAEDASVLGPLAVATPGLVAGLDAALGRYGSMALAEVIAPAIRLAEKGFPISPYHARMLERMRARGFPERFPETARIQFPPSEVAIEPGWRLVQKDLANTLRTLAAAGPEALYGGSLGEAIVTEMEKRGGLLTLADLERYEVALRTPTRGSYRGVDVLSFPPPSSGGVILVQILNILEGFDLGKLGAGSSAGIHKIAEAMKLAFADRAAYLGDPDFVKVPATELISKEYAARQRARIDPPWWLRSPSTWGLSEVAMPVEGPGLPQDDSGTTHFSVTDEEGNAVACSTTINTPFGSGITVPGTGIILNNEMDDFAKAPGEPNVYGLVDTRGSNAIVPLKRPLSSMTPTILVRDDKSFMVTGSPGGPRIITATLLSILNVIDYGMDAQAAVSQPRFHHQWIPDQLSVEREIPTDVIEALAARGHQVDVSPRHWSAVEAIVIDPESGWHTGGSDPRRGGLALGY